MNIEQLHELRLANPTAFADALAARQPWRPDGRKLMVIAADHPARGALAAGSRPTAMADRHDLLQRCLTALARPGVNGFLGTADMVEDLAVLGALDGKIVFGSMNRAGLAGAAFEMDDRFTGYDAAGIQAAGLEGGKMLLRIDLDDPTVAGTLQACAGAVNDLAEAGKIAMVEPFLRTHAGGQPGNDLSPDAVITSMAIASGLGRTSAHTWLKLPCVADMERVVRAATMPIVILGGEVSDDPSQALDGWGRAVQLPGVVGLTIGRSLLYPADDDVAGAVDKAVALL